MIPGEKLTAREKLNIRNQIMKSGFVHAVTGEKLRACDLDLSEAVWEKVCQGCYRPEHDGHCLEDQNPNTK